MRPPSHSNCELESTQIMHDERSQGYCPSNFLRVVRRRLWKASLLTNSITHAGPSKSLGKPLSVQIAVRVLISLIRSDVDTYVPPGILFRRRNSGGIGVSLESRTHASGQGVLADRRQHVTSLL